MQRYKNSRGYSDAQEEVANNLAIQDLPFCVAFTGVQYVGTSKSQSLYA